MNFGKFDSNRCNIYLFNIYFITFLIWVGLTTALTCRTGCECRFYPRRPIICNLAPGLQTFPNDIPAGTYALSVSGTFTTHNNFGNLIRTNFDNISSLRHLSLSFCDIVTIDDGVFASLYGLQTLYLQYNQIKQITSATLDGPTQLKVLDLSGNSNCIIESSAFDSLSSLQELYLGEIGIQTMDKDLFSQLTDLRKLDLHGNLIKKINPVELQSFSTLEYLDLTGNLITTLPNATGPVLSKLHTLHLGENPWHCNCELKWFRTLPMKHIYDRYNTGQNVVCSSPDPLKYRSFLDVPESDFHCTAPKIISCDKSTITVNAMDPITISCVIEGDPFPNVNWRRQNGENFKFGSSSSRFINVLENGTLRISRSTADDDGTWTLVVEDSYGHQERQVNVHILLPTTTSKPTTTTTTHNTISKKVTMATTKPIIKASPKYPFHTQPVSSFSSKPTSADDKANHKEDSGFNILIVAGAAGGVLLLVLLGLIVYCCKRKNKGKVRGSPEEDFDSVRSPRKHNRRNVTTPLKIKKKSVHRTHSYLDF